MVCSLWDYQIKSYQIENTFREILKKLFFSLLKLENSNFFNRPGVKYIIVRQYKSQFIRAGMNKNRKKNT